MQPHLDILLRLRSKYSVTGIIIPSLLPPTACNFIKLYHTIFCQKIHKTARLSATLSSNFPFNSNLKNAMIKLVKLRVCIRLSGTCLWCRNELWRAVQELSRCLHKFIAQKARPSEARLLLCNVITLQIAAFTPAKRDTLNSCATDRCRTAGLPYAYAQFTI